LELARARVNKPVDIKAIMTASPRTAFTLAAESPAVAVFMIDLPITSPSGT
jgi:hypothetical protein